MDFSQFYENVILRDTIEYFMPGLVFLSGVVLLLEAGVRRLQLGISILGSSHVNDFVVIFTAAVFAYVIGHLITGISGIFLRWGEDKHAFEVLEKDSWLKERLVQVIATYMEISENEASELLKDSKKASVMREIARFVMQHRMPILHKEYAARLSILSRFCQNMAVAIVWVLISIGCSTYILWEEIQRVTQPFPEVQYLGIALCLLALAGAAIFYFRSRRIRAGMIKYTFQIWYIDFIERKKASVEPRPTVLLP
jgi:amino acid transporter